MEITLTDLYCKLNMYYILQSVLVLGVQETTGIILQDQPLQVSPLYAKNGKAQCSKKDSKWLLFLMSAKLNLSLKISLQKKSNHIYLYKVQIIKYVQNISTEGLSQVQILYLTHERPLFKVPSIYIFWKTQQSCLKVYSRLFQQVKQLCQHTLWNRCLCMHTHRAWEDQ